MPVVMQPSFLIEVLPLVLYGAQHCFATLARLEQSQVCATFAGMLMRFKTLGALVSVVFTLAAYVVISGLFTSHAA